MQDYNFDLAPERPQWQPGPGPGGFQSGMADYQQSMQEYESSPEYLEWKQRQEARGPLSESTTQAMGGAQHTGRPDIDPFISMGFGSPTATPTYEGYMEMVNRGKENYRGPQTVTSTPSLGGPIQQQIQQGIGALA